MQQLKVFMHQQTHIFMCDYLKKNTFFIHTTNISFSYMNIHQLYLVKNLAFRLQGIPLELPLEVPIKCFYVSALLHVAYPRPIASM